MYDYKSILKKLNDEQIWWLRCKVRAFNSYMNKNSHMTNYIEGQIKGFCIGLAYCDVITKIEADILEEDLHLLAVCGEELEL